jgi:hypothetical protein
MDTALFIAPKTDRTSLLSAEDRGGVCVDPKRGRARLVVADGAGTSHRSGLLAELIVASFFAEPIDAPPPVSAGDNASYYRWHRRISEQWTELAQVETGTEWYQQQNLGRGSAAAFAAAIVEADRCWCLAVGDCCLFQVRPGANHACVASFPMSSWAAFNTTPELFQTDLDRPVIWPRWTHLDLEPGDVIVGASDGIAEWVLAAAVQNPEVWRLLVEMSAADFQDVVAKEREAGTMVDDDTIVVRLVTGTGR